MGKDPQGLIASEITFCTRNVPRPTPQAGARVRFPTIRTQTSSSGARKTYVSHQTSANDRTGPGSAAWGLSVPTVASAHDHPVRRGVGKGPDWSRDSPQVRLLCSLRSLLVLPDLVRRLGHRGSPSGRSRRVRHHQSAAGLGEVVFVSCSRIALYSMARSARCDVRWVATVFVGADGTEKRCSAISSCRSAARTSKSVRRSSREPLASRGARRHARFLSASDDKVGGFPGAIRSERQRHSNTGKNASVLSPPCSAARFPTLAARVPALAARRLEGQRGLDHVREAMRDAVSRLVTLPPP